MSRYIDADKLIDFIDCGHLRNPAELCFSEIDVVNMINKQPTADVKPVVHGEWLNYDRKKLIPTGKISTDEHGNPYKVREWGITHWFRCSNCKYVEEVKTPFCCECGADMRNKESEQK